MPDDNIEEILLKLKTKVSQFTPKETTKSHSITKVGILQGKIPQVLRYGVLPIIMIIILVLSKPVFICKEIVVDGRREKRISIYKLLVTVLIGSLILGGLFLLYLRRKKNI